MKDAPSTGGLQGRRKCTKVISQSPSFSRKVLQNIFTNAPPTLLMTATYCGVSLSPGENILWWGDCPVLVGAEHHPQHPVSSLPITQACLYEKPCNTPCNMIYFLLFFIPNCHSSSIFILFVIATCEKKIKIKCIWICEINIQEIPI